ncbi:MAG: CBS domain-containing protein [Desulfurivibrionaceae bacterium]
MEVITSHLNADFDSMASMIAAKKLYPGAVLSFSGSQEKNVRRFLEHSDLIYDFQRQKNLDLSRVTRLIIVDTRQPSRIGNFVKCLDNPGIEVHLYDHHPDSAGDLESSLEDVRQVGSTATVFVEIFQERNITVTEEEATLLALAEFEDTGSFTFSTTTPRDFAAMSWLLASGANLDTVSQYIQQELTTEEVGLLNELINSAETHTIHGIEIVVTKISADRYIDEFSLIVRRFVQMENLDVLFALAAMGEKVYLICRSRIPEVNVASIALEFQGGGHASAASATIKNMTMVEAEEKLIEMLYKHVQPRRYARDLMSSPPIYTGPDTTIEEANTILSRYGITVLPVLEEGRRVIGYLSRREAGKAIYHNLGRLPVTAFMTSEFATLSPEASLSDIRELIIEDRQRFIPVVADGALVGVITRTDLFSLFVHDPALIHDPAGKDHARSSERHRYVSNLLNQMLSGDLVSLLRKIGEAAARLNYISYAVGGFVRDLLLHTPNFDLDIVVEGDGIAFAKELAREFKGYTRSHAKFNTAVVILPDGFKIDVATARTEYYERPAAAPVVEQSSLKLDLYRRDFSINAMAIHLNPDKFGLLVDFFNSQNDLKDRKLRILHNLSFVDDPTRIFRAVRLEQRLDFHIGPFTERQIKNAVKMNLFDRKLGRRYFQELKLLLSEENPLPAIERLAHFDLLKFIHHSLRLDERLREILSEARRSLAWHRLLYLEESCRPWIVYLMTLFARIQTRGFYAFCRKFEVPRRHTQTLVREKQEAHQVVRTLERRARLKPSEIFNLLDGFSHEGLLYIMALCRNKSGKQAVSSYVTNYRHVKPHIRGKDLKEIGYKPGPVYQEILDHLREAVLDGKVESREDELEFLETYYPLQEQ